MQDETELKKFLEENGVTEETKPEEAKDDRLYDFSEKKPTVSTEEKPEDKVEDEEEDVPFHKNPKVLKFLEKREQKIREELESQFQSFKPEVREHSQEEDEDPLTDVLTRIIGNDTPEKLNAIKDFRKALESRDEMVKESALREIEARTESERQAEIEAQNEVYDAIDDIEDTFNIDLTSGKPSANKLRNDFIDFVKRVAPKDSTGEIISYPDWKETFALFKERNEKPAPSNDRAKDIANRSISNANVADAKPAIETFSDMDKWLESLSN